MNFALTRKLIIFGLVLPLAAIIGFTLATPQEFKTFALMGAVTGLLLLPIMLKWYHPLLIFSWNALVNVYFLPGKPELWMLFTAIGFGIVVLNSAIDREKKALIHVPALTIPLVFFLTIVLITAKLTGGIGVRAIGGAHIGGGVIGGKGYFTILFAIIGYFVLSSRVVPVERVKTYLSVFFLAGATPIFSNLAYMLGPAFYFLFYLFPIEYAVTQAMAEFGYGGILRITGLGMLGTALYFMIMARYGIVGILDPRRWWRLVLFVGAIIISLFGGFRTMLLTFIVHFFCQFYFERLLRTRLAVILLVGGIGLGALALPFVEKMPHAVQRSFAWLAGVEVSHIAKADTENSTRWRVEMWMVLLPEIPKYLILGKGYALNTSDLYLAHQAQLRGLARQYEVAMIGGSYHNGPLSVIIPFGIFGTLGFLWMLVAGLWVLYRNYRYGDPALQMVNTFLLAYFTMRVLVFLFIFGALDAELYKFTGILGLTVAINGGVRKPTEESLASRVPTLQPAPA